MRDSETCGGKCLNTSLPTLSFKSEGLEPYCINLQETSCIPEGIGASYMCNGICIPYYIPCNNTCLDNVLLRSDRKEELFGPFQCQDFEDRKIVKDNLMFLKSVLDFQGFCLPGFEPCNEMIN